MNERIETDIYTREYERQQERRKHEMIHNITTVVTKGPVAVFIIIALLTLL